jgi:hypothetical protein
MIRVITDDPVLVWHLYPSTTMFDAVRPLKHNQTENTDWQTRFSSVDGKDPVEIYIRRRSDKCKATYTEGRYIFEMKEITV